MRCRRCPSPDPVKPGRFFEEAQEEFLEQVTYYEEREKGLGERFRQAVEAAAALRAPFNKAFGF